LARRKKYTPKRFLEEEKWNSLKQKIIQKEEAVRE
jgi:hypothetical protein